MRGTLAAVNHRVCCERAGLGLPGVGKGVVGVGLFEIVVGIALLLIGTGLLVLTIRWIREPKPVASTQPKPAAASVGSTISGSGTVSQARSPGP
jgi:hypothetical protein